MIRLAALLALLVWLMAGCVTPHRSPGATSAALGGGLAATLTPPESPAAASRQNITRRVSRHYAPAMPAAFTAPPLVRQTAAPDDEPKTDDKRTSPDALPSPTPAAPGSLLSEEITETAAAEVAPSHVDQGEVIAAKMAAMRPITMAGLAFLVAGLASFHPVARAALGGGKQIPLLILGAGLVLTFAPSLLVGHETLALVLAAGGIGLAWLLTRLARKEAEADAIKSRSPVAVPPQT